MMATWPPARSSRSPSFFGALVYLYSSRAIAYGDDTARGARVADRRLPVRDLLRRALHRVAVPARHRRRLLSFFETAVRPRRRLGAARRPDPARRVAAGAAARMAGADVDAGARSNIEGVSAAAAPVAGPADLFAVHLAAHRRSARLLQRPSRVGTDVSGRRLAGREAVLDPRQRRAERLRRHTRLRRAQRDRRAVRARDDLAGGAPSRAGLRPVHGRQHRARRWPTAACCRPAVFHPCCFPRLSGWRPRCRPRIAPAGSRRSPPCRHSARRCSTRGGRSSDLGVATPAADRDRVAHRADGDDHVADDAAPDDARAGTRRSAVQHLAPGVDRARAAARSSHLFDANIFYPHQRTLAYSDAMLFEGMRRRAVAVGARQPGARLQPDVPRRHHVVWRRRCSCWCAT